MLVISQKGQMSRDLWGADFSLGCVYFPGHLQGGRGFLEGAWGGGVGQGQDRDTGRAHLAHLRREGH